VVDRLPSIFSLNNMKKIVYILGFATLMIAEICAQEPEKAPLAVISGLVTNPESEPLIGASVQWKGAATGTITDVNGRFSIPARQQPDSLIIRYVGHLPTAVEVLPEEDNIWIEVHGTQVLSEIQIKGHVFDNATSMLEARNIERISARELTKAPCCNLSESFQTNGTVDVGYADPLTGVRDIRMLGLRGIYSQFLLENRPAMGGIATPFAFEMIPGTWLEGIQIAKGASSVVAGYAGITGQINAELVKPATDKPVFVNVFTSTEGRAEVNLHLNSAGEGRWSQGLLAHASVVENNWDMNSDNFYDMSSRRQLNGLYRAQYHHGKATGQFNLQALTDRRTGGQIRELQGERLFAINQQHDRMEAWGKYARSGVLGRPFNQWGNMVSASWHQAAATYGKNTYQASQQSVYAQSILETILKTTDHKLVVAPSFQLDRIEERMNDIDLGRTEIIPGAMTEYTYSRPNLSMGMPDLVVVVGARVDHNSRFGWLFTPRMSARYNMTAATAIRVAGGYGYRSPHLMAENINVLASNRTLHFAPDLLFESAWNYGFNLTHAFKILGRPATTSLDLYRTDFDRQILVDVDASPTDVYFRYAEGPSWANSAIAMLQVSPYPGTQVRLGGKLNDVRAAYAGGRYDTPVQLPRYRGLLAADFETPSKRWMFNATLQYVGRQRLPDNSTVPHELHHDHAMQAYAPHYLMLGAQVTHRWKTIEVYVGGENLTGFRQHDAILSASDPWSPYFNATQVWAPIMGAIGYAGMRFTPAAR